MSKVAVYKCTSYDEDTVFQVIKRAVNELGGIGKFVSRDKKILIKPNLLTHKSHGSLATTNSSVFNGVVRLLRESGYENVYFGDSPGIGTPKQVAKSAGILDIADKWGVPMLDFESGSVVSYPSGRISKQFEIASGVSECEEIISLPKMKSHQLTRITGAVKNQLGCVYGLNKAAFHVKFPNAVDFSKMLVDLNKLLPVKLFIMDGVIAMEGNGPSGGNPVNMNVIIVSDDPIAVDTAFCRLIDLDPEFVPFIKYGRELGLSDGVTDMVGDDISGLINKDYDVVRSPVRDETLFGFLVPLKNLIIRRPYIDKKNCVRCGICSDACPVNGKALKIKAPGKYPEYDYMKCIRCYCCQEMCPHKAIKVKMPFWGRILLYRKSGNKRSK